MRTAKTTNVMRNLFSIVAIAAVVLGATGAAAQDLPTFEMRGLAITQHQVAVVGSASLQEQAPTAKLALDGMPASSHQVAVLTPRQRITEARAAKLATVDVSAR
jgi:hypothetical protein